MLTEAQKEQVKATVPVLRENGVALTKYFYQRMLSNNPGLKETFNMGHQRSGAQAKALAGSVLAYAENIDDPSVLAPVVELICNKHVSLNIQAPDYDIVGENLLHSISEVLQISMNEPLISAWGAAYKQLADLFITTEKAMYERKAEIAGGWLGWRNFIVDRKVVESDEITSFYLVPEDKKPLPAYLAGQYVTVRVTVPELGIKQPRQYSLSDRPSGEYLRISVKREDASAAGQDPGYVSSTLHQAIKEGDVVELTSPTGNFFLADPNATNVLISAGVGLTPMVAMLNQLTAENGEPPAAQRNPVYFIHAVRNSAVQAMRKELRQIAADNPRVRLYFAYEHVSQGDIRGKDYHQEGRLDLSKAPAEYLPADADYYLCGPIPFMQLQKAALLTRGVPEARIHSEAFGTGGVPA
ncbi:NO-inducible flavohemoprotein [Brenneria populi subsp. brevivirga]|uniref:NO-inducible flavohemoprotein n=1 Tax=Brenneria populi TaxID=1505588 RepID=UPI002E19BCE6|nr:NO-inducible flavohemoprotein [Brenneria populi subsp. brevivirga]